METNTYADFLSLISSPWVKILESAFFFFALSHGLTGIDSILENYRFFNTSRQAISRFLWLLGGCLFLGITILILRI
jgi:succinate dehydrogenase hydrophobic anchor subunit